MDNLIFSLNATIPVFLVMVLGYFFHKIRLVDDSFVKTLNSFNFKVTLPVLLFQDLSSSDFRSVWDTKYVLFCFFATLISIILIWIITAKLYHKKDYVGEFVQASYRSSAAILGIAIIQNLYGDPGMAPLMIIASVPLYNIMAVTVLSFMKPGSHGMDRKMILKTLKGIATNPIILGILVGLAWSVFDLPLPTILSSTVNNLGKTATPLGLMAMGGALHFGKAFSRPKATIACTFMKLAGFCAIFLPIAIRLGFTHDKLVSILIMLGSATTVSCCIMAKNMGHEGSFSSSVIMLTTLLSAFTLTGWLFICKTLGVI